MLKGCQKRLVMLKPGENSVFESAWFVLREDKQDVAYDDMVAEANRIAAGGIAPKYMRRSSRKYGLSMLCGIILGGALAALVFFLICK